MTTPRPSIYKPLDNPNEEIRLIEILSQSPDEKVGCKLHTVSLGTKPYYICLSYVWGDPSVTEVILVDDIPTQVTVNLASALKHVKKHWINIKRESGNPFSPSDFRIWADAICINQDDLVEKTAQVQLMTNLYSSAEFSLGWLSPTDEGIADALSTFHGLFNALGTCYKARSGHEVPDLDGPDWADDVIEMRSVLATPHNALHFDQKDHTSLTNGLGTFASCPFWTRVWIQQEITLTPNVYYACPAMTISHGKLCFTVDSLHSMLTDQRYVNEAPLLESAVAHKLAGALDIVFGRLLIRFIAHMPSLHSKLLVRLNVLIDTFSGELEATRPVDYVYGLLSLSGLEIVPDYSRTASDVWLELVTKYLEIFQTERPEPDGTCPAREFLEPHGILQFVQLCGAGLRRDDNLPTWAPVLSPLRKSQYRFPVCEGSSRVYMGLLELQGYPYPRVIDHSLWVTAVRIQTVSRCDKEPLCIQPLEIFAKTVATQVESFLATHGPTYISGQPLLTALSSTLFNQEDTGSSLEMLYHILLVHGLASPRLSEQMIRDGLKRLPYETVERHLVEWAAKRGFIDGQKFICTEGRYIGLAGADVQQGDVVCIIAHLNQPAIFGQKGSITWRAKMEVIEIK
ncbi:hypothetical protein CEP54_015565 [Fusarium duplospermum]|uniref:Heterokaryon incompatibility domain-containing protein n=1 Tax=Fusarium duplospermum TaxID=1325734 RepID=A0A428NN29_9HYPO|nr:hypothetical protein CEP54_015565 [Fusarium duplospermum]